ncbi:MAG: Ig-like domain-containing protein [Gemmatimonadota bacterium]
MRASSAPARSSSLIILAAASVLTGCLAKSEPKPIAAIAVSNAQVAFTGEPGGPPADQVINVINGGDASVSVEGLALEISYSGQPPAQWLTASLDNQTATIDQPARLTIHAADAGLPIGSYTGAIALTSSNAGNSPTRVNVTLTIQARQPRKIGFVTEPPATARSGDLLAQRPVVQLLGFDGTPVQFAGVVITAAIESGGGTLNGTTNATTGADGKATFTDLGIVGTVGAKTLRFSSPGLTSAISTAINLTAGAAVGMTAQSAQTQSKQAGLAVDQPPAVIVKDAAGNGVPGVVVTFAAGAGTIVPNTPITTDASGVAALTSWTLGAAAGAQTVTATAAGLVGASVVFTATAVAGPAVALTKTAGDNLTGEILKALGTAHEVQVSDQLGNPVAGVTVTWAPGIGGGSVSPTTSTTGINGRASSVRTLGDVVGPQTTVATAALPGGPTSVTFAITGVLDANATMTKVAGDAQTAPVNTVLPVQLSVRVNRGNGTPAANVPVTWRIVTGAGSFTTGATVSTDGAGLASVTWKLGTAAGTQSVEAQAVGTPALFTATATAGPVSGATSSIAVSPASVPIGSPATVTVTARDAFSNPVAGAAVTIAATGTGNTVTQPGTPTNVAGVATGTISSTVAGVKTVSGTVGGTAITTSQALTVTAGAPNAGTSTVTANPTNPLLNGAGSTISVTVRDGSGNPVGGASVTFGASGGSPLNPGIFDNVSSPRTLTANGSGFVSSVFNSPYPGTYPISVTANGVPLTGTSVTIEVSFVVDILPNFMNGIGGTSACTNCHFAGGSEPQSFSQANLVNVAPILRGGFPLSANVRVKPGDPNNSYLINVLEHAAGADPMPSGAQSVPASFISLIRVWILQGAKNN